MVETFVAAGNHHLPVDN